MNHQAEALTASRLRPTLERTCTTRDGTGLFYRCWPATCGRRKGAILLFHRGHEHSGRMAHLVDELDLPEFAFYACDQRGHGRSERGRGAASGLARAVPTGGYLVYTCQPWHPQLELIARALTSHRQGQAWVMRRRTQAEMDELVEDAGFAKVEQLIDEWGIFSVSLARRVGR